MKHDFSLQCGLKVAYDDILNVVEFDDDVITEDRTVRQMKEMRNLFVNATGFDDEFPLYYMYNGIYHKNHQRIFEDAKIKYELTILPALKVNGEFLKAHGHIHSIRPIKNTRHVEIYEILLGEGLFEMFKEIDGKLHTVIMKVKVGDRFIVPGDYFHLSINTGSLPFIFSDFITLEASNDYGPLKQKDGAPFFAMVDPFGKPEYLFNDRYDFRKLSISFVDIDSLPWDNPVPNVPLYPQFLARPEIFDFLTK